MFFLPSDDDIIAWICIVLAKECREVVRGGFSVSSIKALVNLSTTNRSIVGLIIDQILMIQLCRVSERHKKREYTNTAYDDPVLERVGSSESDIDGLL
jgi:hypothetical protein